MQELMTNFQHKHRKKVPLPKIYANEDSSDSEGLELQDRTQFERKEAVGVSLVKSLPLVVVEKPHVAAAAVPTAVTV